MKKTFSLSSPNAKPGNQLDNIRHEIKKYFARERRKKLPDGFSLWKFDCKFGDTAQDAAVVQESEIKDLISRYAAEKKNSFYIEILARPDNKSGNKPSRKNKSEP